MDVVAAPAEVVVSIPIDVRSEHSNVGLRPGRSDNPRKGEEITRHGFGVQVVQPRSIWRRDVLPMVWIVAVATVVELNAGLRVIAVRGDLRRGKRTVFVEPANRANVFLFPTIPPQIEPLGFSRMDAILSLFTSLHPFRPHVTNQTIVQ